MRELRELARKLLSDGSVQLVIGYEEGRRGVRPSFATDAAGCDKLVFDHRCVQNLAAYLSPRRALIVGAGKPAVVVKGCDARAVAVLLRETQIRREHVVLIGARCGGVVSDTEHAGLTEETVADKCVGCELREPKLVDHLLGPLPPAPPGKSRRDPKLAELQAMTPEARWSFWTTELARCVRCHACREVCPLCFCERCLADQTQPQWLESSPHPRGNLAWHIARAMHLAGRCVDCGECERVCPADIPLSLISRKVAQVVQARFGYRPTDDPNVQAPIGAYRLDDQQEFIL